MSEQISFLGKEFYTDEEIAELERQAQLFSEYAKQKSNWENATLDDYCSRWIYDESEE